METIQTSWENKCSQEKEKNPSWFVVEPRDESVYSPLTEFCLQLLCSWRFTIPAGRSFGKQRSPRALLSQALHRGCWYWDLESKLWAGYDPVWSSTGTDFRQKPSTTPWYPSAPAQLHQLGVSDRKRKRFKPVSNCMSFQPSRPVSTHL